MGVKEDENEDEEGGLWGNARKGGVDRLRTEPLSESPPKYFILHESKRKGGRISLLRYLIILFRTFHHRLARPRLTGLIYLSTEQLDRKEQLIVYLEINIPSSLHEKLDDLAPFLTVNVHEGWLLVFVHGPCPWVNHRHLIFVIHADRSIGY